MTNGMTKRLAGAALLGMLMAGVSGCSQDEPPSTTVVTPAPAPASKDTTVVVPSATPGPPGPPGPAGSPGPPGPAGASGSAAPK